MNEDIEQNGKGNKLCSPSKESQKSEKIRSVDSE